MISVKGYRILKKLGSGGMAMVYLAEHEKLGKKVAIKVLSDLLTSNSSVRKRFIQEARVMASLRHPGIVDVTDFIEEEHLLAIVMEYIPGRTLDTMIGSEVGPIPYKKAVPLFRQILEAVAYAHSKGVIHRDLKPANVMVTVDEKIKVMDFGIAKIAGQTGMTRTGTQLGTLYYMSPEQIHGAGSIDSRADIYSLGITLYEMLAGRLPFETDGGTSEFQIMNSIVNRENHLDPRDYYPHIPEWLVNVVRKATAKNPSKRFQNCNQMIEAISNVEKYSQNSASHHFPASHSNMHGVENGEREEEALNNRLRSELTTICEKKKTLIKKQNVLQELEWESTNKIRKKNNSSWFDLRALWHWRKRYLWSVWIPCAIFGIVAGVFLSKIYNKPQEKTLDDYTGIYLASDTVFVDGIPLFIAGEEFYSSFAPDTMLINVLCRRRKEIEILTFDTFVSAPNTIVITADGDTPALVVLKTMYDCKYADYTTVILKLGNSDLAQEITLNERESGRSTTSLAMSEEQLLQPKIIITTEEMFLGTVFGTRHVSYMFVEERNEASDLTFDFDSLGFQLSAFREELNDAYPSITVQRAKILTAEAVKFENIIMAMNEACKCEFDILELQVASRTVLGFSSDGVGEASSGVSDGQAASQAVLQSIGFAAYGTGGEALIAGAGGGGSGGISGLIGSGDDSSASLEGESSNEIEAVHRAAEITFSTHSSSSEIGVQGRTMNDIRRKTNMSIMRIKRAYEDLLRSNPTASGTISVNFSITPGGSVVNVSVSAPGPLSSLTASVKAAVQSLNFGPSSEQTGNIPMNVSMNLITSE